MLSYFQNKYTYLSVDEAQDTSTVQHRIIELLAQKNNNIFMVGDEDQSIYGFRGAYPEALIKFRKQYKDPFILFMENNFRSTKEIVDVAAKFIKINRDRYKKNIHAVRGSGEKVERINVADRAEQYSNLVDRLADCTEDTAGFSYTHINGRLVVDYGTSVEQYMVLTDDELADYLKHGTQTGE